MFWTILISLKRIFFRFKRLKKNYDSERKYRKYFWFLNHFYHLKNDLLNSTECEIIIQIFVIANIYCIELHSSILGA